MGYKTLYLSEILNKTFESVEELEAAEKEYLDKQAEKEAAKAERKRRADEVSAAYEEIRKAQEKYEKLLSAFLKDYKTYHTTYTTNTMPLGFKDFFKVFEL